MHDRSIQLQLGAGAIIASILLLAVAIPLWVSSPSNVPNIILSPLFWPWTLSGLTGLVGAGMVFNALREPKPSQPPVSDVTDKRAAWIRLLTIAFVMLLTMMALPRIGMVWTSMLVFAASAFLVRTSHPRTALISAVVVPLVLYAFFAHVAGVAIPQGDFVRLP